MAQLTEQERNLIEFHLRGRLRISEIATILGRPRQTITNEIRKRRFESRKGCQEKNARCVHFGECRRTHVCDVPCGMNKQCRHCHECFLQCRDFEERRCDRLERPPFVCNGCADENRCILPKNYYFASDAQKDRLSRLHDSRRHIQTSDEQCARMDEALKEGLPRRQSIHHIMAANPDAFEGVSERTVYGYIGSECLTVGRGDLPSACSRRPRAKKAVTRTKAKCRVGRTHDLFVAWKLRNEGALVPEADTLKGRIGGKVLFTINFPCQFMMAFIKERETAQTWTGIVNQLYRAASPHLFAKLFPAILEDNGAPFLDPVMTENARVPNIPYKLVPRTKVFYCDPYCATQKPHVERNHEELRRILIKGTSFDALDQEDVNAILSHVNSYTRASIGDSTPYDRFVETYGPESKRLLDILGIRRIPANQITLCPLLLGKRFQRHADRTILKRNGVTKEAETRKPQNQK